VVLVTEETDIDLDSLASAMRQQAELRVVVDTVETSAAALDQLCRGEAQLVTLNAFAAVVAEERGCGDGVNVAVRDGSTTQQSQFVVSVTRGINGISAFVAQDFCRPDATSLTGWGVPALRLQQEGIDPIDDITSAADLGDDEDVLLNVLDNTCDVGVTSVGAEQTADIEDLDRIRVIEELPPVPNQAIFVQSGLSARFDALLRDLIDEFGEELGGVVDADGWESYDRSAYEPLLTLFEAASINPVEFGQ
jgi:ABC-type phosphate/phosphonate transport system substrate-binding protein